MNRRPWRVFVTAAILAVFAVSCAAVPAEKAAEAGRAPAKKIDLAGCSNLYQVDEGLYRGAQPTLEGFRELKKLGVKTVVNLRGDDIDREGIADTKLGYVLLPVPYYQANDEEIVKFLQVVTDKNRRPVFVHCNSGANRTGMMVAVYRVAVSGWKVDEALKEMRTGYGAQGGGPAFDEYMNKLDVAGLRKKAGLSADVRNPAWATPIDRPGCPNLFKVNDALYRGAQPTAEGFRELKKMGVKTVVDLRMLHSDLKELAGTGLEYEHIGMEPWHAENKEVAAFLKIVSDPKRAPIFVHCQHGSDRTGTVMAAYRIMMRGWTKNEAIKEMTQGGYGFHEAWQNLVEYIEKLNVDDIRRAAGLKVPDERQ